MNVNKKLYGNLVNMIEERIGLANRTVLRRGHGRLSATAPQFGLGQSKLNVRNIVDGPGPTRGA